MKVYFLRRKNLGKGSIAGILRALREQDMLNEFNEVEGYLSDGRKHTPGNETVYTPASLPTDADLCIRWGCTSNVPLTNGQTQNAKVWNKAKNIHLVSDKAKFRKLVADHDLAMPTSLNYLDMDHLTYPVVVRPKVHAQGKKLYVCNNHQEVHENAYLCGPEYYISELVNKVREYRVFILHGRVVWVAEKKPGNPEQVAWNVAQGGVFENVKWGQWDKAVVANALSSYDLSGLDFGGVDVMVDGDGKAYCLEINSGPSQTSPYRQTCVARAIAWELNHGHAPDGVVTSNYNWKDVIHPGVLAFSQEG